MARQASTSWHPPERIQPMSEIQTLSIRHEAIMDYLMANPTVRLMDVAKAFKVTQGWLSQIIHSDAFQQKLSEKQNVVFHDTVLPLREKMVLVAHQALDRLAETLPMETETRTVAQVAEGVLDRLGFGTKNQPPVQVHQHQHVHLLRSEIEAARELIGARPGPPLGVTINGERAPIGLGAPEAVPAEVTPSVGPRLAAFAPVPAYRSEGDRTAEARFAI